VTVLLRSDGRVDADTYIRVTADAPGPSSGGDVVVSLGLWERERGRLLQSHRRVGVRLASDESPDRIAPDLDDLAMIALEFPTFRDGRAYSHARALRERYGYRGEVRAVGDVLIEQLPFMLRVGFDAFELESDDPAGEFNRVAGEMSVWYQPASDNRASASELRRGR